MSKYLDGQTYHVYKRGAHQLAVWVSNSDALFPGKGIRDRWFKNGKGYREFVEAYRPRGDEHSLLEEL